MRRNNELNLTFNPLEYPIIYTFPNRLVEPTSWIQHIPFAMFLVDIIRPKIIVELGTHSGNSYCAFCQAVSILNISTNCYAIDTWKGDAHAGFYSEHVLKDLQIHHDSRYKGFSKLLQSTFDEAIKGFSNNSISLLHIDGLHTYEAVKHDFETWLPKMSQKGVVLFHDISERTGDFGVWRLWEELKLKYPSFEFFHSHGLGVLAVGSDYPPLLDLLLKSPNNTQIIQDFFYRFSFLLEAELLNQRIQKQMQVNETLLTELNQSKAEILFYANSKSWQVTRPLRKLLQIINKRRNEL